VTPAAVTWRLRTQALSNEEHTLVMGVLNVTPDSFSDGGRYLDHSAAVAHGLAMYDEGADLIDVGGESTRPGGQPVPLQDELDRVIPVVASLAAEGVVVSVDTSTPEVASAAIEAGAEVVNDVTALADDEMAEVCAASGAGVALMHMKGSPATMQDEPTYADVVADVTAYLADRVAAATAAGIDETRVCVDPGIGFGKTVAHNLALLAGLGTIAAMGRPVLVGTSRKRFIGSVLEAAGISVAVERRDVATGATVALAIANGASVVRVHDVAGALQVARMADAIVRSGR
jgi:dihydropteroate synthase